MVNSILESEGKYKVIFDLSPEAIVVLDKKGNFIDANNRLKEWLGYSPEEIVGKNITSAPFFSFKSKALVVKNFTMRMLGRDVPPYELEFVTKDKKIKVGLVRATPVRDGEGKVVGDLVMVSDITKEKLAEEKAKMSEERFRLLFEATQDLVTITDAKGGTLWANPAWESVFGPVSEYKDDPFEMVHQDDREKVKRAYELLMSGEGEFRDVEYRYNLSDGKQMVFVTSVYKLEVGGDIRLYVVGRDVTDRRKAEEELKKSEGKYRNLFESMVSGFAYHQIVVDDDGKPIDYLFLEVNDAFENLTGLKREQVVGKKVTEALPGIEKDPTDWIGKYGEVALSGKEIRFESYAEPLDRWYSILAYSPQKNYFVAIFNDITERKKAEEELKKAAVYIDAMGEALMVMDMQRRVVKLNKTGLKLWGYTEEESLNLTFEDVVPKREHERQYALMQEAIEKGPVDPFETFIITKSGKEVTVLLSGSVLKDDSGKPVGFVGVFRDVTELKYAKAVAEELRKLDKMKDEFLDIAAHELRTPLTAIRGNSSLIARYYPDKIGDEELRESIDDIASASIRLTEVVDDFLNVSRLEGKRIEFSKEEVDLQKLIEEVIEELGNLASEKDIALEFEKFPGDTFTIMGDESKIRQVMTNLVGNAIKFTKEGEVGLKVERMEDFVKVKVSDTGLGISMEKQNLLFQKFQQVGENRLTRDVTSGSGLGLYISKMLIEGMGGKIYLEESSLGKGSIFAFELPVAKGR